MVAPESLEQVAFFRNLEPQERAMLAPISHKRQYKAGETIFAEGTHVDSLRILVSGMVSFRQQQRSGGEEISIGSICDEGAAFGITALVARDMPGPHSAVCVEDTEVIEVDGAELMSLCEKEPGVGLHLLLKLAAVMAERLTAAREQIRSRVSPGLISHG